MRGDPPRNPRRSTEKPTEMHRGPKNFDSSKKSNIKVADASTPTTVFSNFFSTVLRGTRQKLVARTVYRMEIVLSLLVTKYMYIKISFAFRMYFSFISI